MAVVVVVVVRRRLGRGRGDGDGVEQGRCERERHSLDGGHDDGCAFFPAPGLLYILPLAGGGRKIPEILDDFERSGVDERGTLERARYPHQVARRAS